MKIVDLKDAKVIVANATQKLSKYDSEVEPFSIFCNH